MIYYSISRSLSGSSARAATYRRLGTSWTASLSCLGRWTFAFIFSHGCEAGVSVVEGLYSSNDGKKCLKHINYIFGYGFGALI